MDRASRSSVAAIGAGAVVADGRYLQGPADVALNMIVPTTGAFTVLGNITRVRYT
jgi:hypothetical protein